jgi:hypothetical protein
MDDSYKAVQAALQRLRELAAQLSTATQLPEATGYALFKLDVEGVCWN